MLLRYSNNGLFFKIFCVLGVLLVLHTDPEIYRALPSSRFEVALVSALPRRSAQNMSSVIMAGFVTVDFLHLTLSKRESEQKITSSDCGDDVVIHTLPSYLLTRYPGTRASTRYEYYLVSLEREQDLLNRRQFFHEKMIHLQFQSSKT